MTLRQLERKNPSYAILTFYSGNFRENGYLARGLESYSVEMDNLQGAVEELSAARCTFRTEIVIGRGGKQRIMEDPAGDPIERFGPV